MRIREGGRVWKREDWREEKLGSEEG